MRAMDLIEPGFRPLYERICVGNKGADNQDIFFEGMLLSEGLGMDLSCATSLLAVPVVNLLLQAKTKHGTASQRGAILISIASLYVLQLIAINTCIANRH